METYIRCSQQAGPGHIYGLQILQTTLYFVCGPGNIAKIRKYKTSITTPNVTTFVLRTLFGMAPKAVAMYNLDSSGIHLIPRSGSKIEPHNRIDHLTHVNFHKYLLGDSLPRLYQSFSDALLERVASLPIRDQWTTHPDIMNFWLEPLTAAMNEALAGKLLETVNPNFTKDLLRFFTYTQDLVKGLPRWYIPEAYNLRDSLIGDVKSWHIIAKARSRESNIVRDGSRHPCWGSEFMRDRHRFQERVDNWDANAIASSDFGVFWG